MTEVELKTLMMQGYIMGYGMTNGEIHGVVLPNGDRLEGVDAIETKFATELEVIRNG